MILSRFKIFLAWATCAQLARCQQMDITAEQDRWLAVYENMRGILSKLVSPLLSTDFNETTESNPDTFNHMIAGLEATESESGHVDGYEAPGNLTIECASDEDCHNYAVTLSCVGADAFRNGRCMNPLKPSEHGCEYDDQCKKTCKESYCSMDGRFRNDRGENQCRCQKGTYFLWKKCWKSCLPGTRPMQLNDEWSCQELDPHAARANPLDFNIEPSGIGLLRPNATRPFTLIALPELDRSAECTLILEFALVDSTENQDGTDAATVWSRVKLENLTKTGIKTIFGPDATADEESETTVIVINEAMLDEPEKQASVAQVIWRIRNRNPDAWWLLKIFLLILAIISFLCGLWLGSRTKNDRNDAESAQATMTKNEM